MVAKKAVTRDNTPAPEGQEVVRKILAGAGACPAPFPTEWNPDTAQAWADLCLLRYKTNPPAAGEPRKHMLTTGALRLWLMRKYSLAESNRIVSMITPKIMETA